MSRVESLRRLEQMLESFLERAVASRGDRVSVLQGINRLDDIARLDPSREDLTGAIGDWFAQHNNWLSNKSLRRGDRGRIGTLLEQIRDSLHLTAESPLADQKVADEIDRWFHVTRSDGHKVVLQRGGEIAPSPSSGRVDHLALFGEHLRQMGGMYSDLIGHSDHLISTLNQALDKAEKQLSKDALLLSALLIYYLRQSGYLVAPFVKRLKEAERLQKGTGARA